MEVLQELGRQLGTDVPPQALHVLLVLALSFLIGLEREGHKTDWKFGAFGGVRTFPLIGLLGFGLALVAPGSVLLPVAGLLAVAALLSIALQRKLLAAAAEGKSAGITSEVSALVVYLIGLLAERGQLWLAATLAIACLILLELKAGLERLSQRFSGEDVLTLAKFLALSVVILPLLPDTDLGPFAINPFKTWLVVVAVTGISYASYLLQRFLPASGSVRLTALLGGAYSSTLTTVALARKSAAIGNPRLVSGSLLMASGVMYLRVAVLVGLFSGALVPRVSLPCVGLALAAVLGGWLWSRRRDQHDAPSQPESRNPLELSSAFIFAVLFVVLVAATKLVLKSFGSTGLLFLAAVMGLTDVDPFILGVAQGAGDRLGLPLAAAAIVVAAASNNLIKGVYALAFGDRATGRQTFALLAGLAALGLTPLLL